jgi:predicted enzyme related to lactoylglutathione lyase
MVAGGPPYSLLYASLRQCERRIRKMKVSTLLINLTSEDPALMKAFYEDIVELPKREGMGDGAFAIGDATLSIDGHSETHGKAKEPQRVLIDFFVDDLAAEQARLEARGVEFIRKAGREYWGGVISTFLDPDGNYCQLIEYKGD